MTCDEVRHLIHEAHDGQAPEAPELHAHLASCDACRSLAEDLESLSSALRSLPRIPLPPDALDSVWHQTSRRRHAGFAAWRFAAAAGFVSLLSATALYLTLAPAPPPKPSAPSAIELAQAEAEAELVLGYTARALGRARSAAADRVLASKISPAVRGGTSKHPTRRP